MRNLTEKSAPICIKAHTFGKNLPFENLYVSPAHSLLLGGKMVRADELLNGTTIVQDNLCDQVTYYHLELDEHSSIVANGILSESYLDAKNRRDVFEPSRRLKPILEETPKRKNTNIQKI